MKNSFVQHPADQDVMSRMARGEPGVWLRQRIADTADLPDIVSDAAIAAAEARFARFTPLLARLFAADGWDGVIRSPLIPFPLDAAPLALAKCDNTLLPTGSIKARGGLHELLWLVERIGREHGLIGPDGDGGGLLDAEALALLARHRVVAASTGNLGYCIGRIARAFGMAAEIHLSRDAKAWKKDQLRAMGADVVEHDGDYAETVARARAVADAPDTHFVDDERSHHLFTGYACAARELQRQLDVQGINPTSDTPILVYLPCGVGGAPGGITRGLKSLFGAGAICVFVEPVASACVTAALAVGGTPSVASHGGDNNTIADGLAVPRASELVMAAVGSAIDAAVTVTDTEMLDWVRVAWERAELRLEPSAAASFAAHARLLETAASWGGPIPAEAIPVFWCTGGARMPEAEFAALLHPFD